ncbi:DNA adenine methylase [Erythrobacter litoralis]|uniref:DNA-methyltransferase n=1 Tax=Erythrobacter litoralis (strain HTCC2594) TaxID=314225 RepID=Q2N9A3_ERYLH|nr:DNA adenine methylase [Erythrobacter litoralis]ABC63738.1 DNA-methyltransferase [Erythrobacter litoralis HTCC2594]
MARSQSPLRYPGGKSALAEVTASLIRENGIGRAHYVEPYAGGASLALHLLYTRQVSDIHLNDLDPGIWSFWHSVINHAEELIRLIDRCEITVDEWHHQKSIYREADTSAPLKLGFATFFLNRTNRSGIIGSGGIIGGLQQQGNYKIDCRFNKYNLVQKIRKINRYRNSIHLTNLDAVEFLQSSDVTLSERTLYMIDPPYYEKGSSLYTNFYGKDDHSAVRDAIAHLSKPWIVTYDNCDEISDLYRDFDQIEFGISYSANKKRTGKELMIVSPHLRFAERTVELIRKRLPTPIAA